MRMKQFGYDTETIQKRNEKSFYRNVLANFVYDKFKKFF